MNLSAIACLISLHGSGEAALAAMSNCVQFRPPFRVQFRPLLNE